MGDCRPTISGRGELSEKEKQVLGGFWIYVQPMSLYRHIEQRQQFQAFEPLSAQLLKLGKSSGHDSSTAVNVKVHYQHQHQSAQLGVMLLTAGDPLVAHSLDALKRTKRSKTGTKSFSLTPGCTLDKAFGLIPSGDVVFWHFTELPARWDMQSPLKLKARLRKGIMKTVAGGTGCMLQLTSQAVQGPIFDTQLGPQPNHSTRPMSAGGTSCSHSSRRGQAGSTGSHTPASKPSGCAIVNRSLVRWQQGRGMVQLACLESFAVTDTAAGLQKHIEASHDLFDFEYSQGEADVVPAVTVQCPGKLYNQQGTLQNPEADDIGDGTDCKEIYFECRSKKLRALKLQQYDMAEEERASLPACLTHNQFNKAAWKSWHASMYGDEQRPLAKLKPPANPGDLARATSELLDLAMQATASSASQAHSSDPPPLRPFLVQPHPPTHPQPYLNAPGTSHVEATASTSITHSAIPMPASSAATNRDRGATAPAKTSNCGDDDATASAKTGKRPVSGQQQVQSRKRGRLSCQASRSQERPVPVYFHARSCSRMTPQEVSHILQDPHAVTDSDDEEDDRERSKARAVRQLDKLTGVNTAEKNLMLSWNMYLHDHPCLSDAQMGQRCIDFAAEQVQAMRADSELRRCFMVHLVNLWEFNIVSSDLVHACMVSIDAQP
ncbi:MAG: Polycomb suz12 [Trebouxia sp. A1-2]|nr:MAG: Polycomb suz12 [Trebouxia sp. A1-2]